MIKQTILTKTEKKVLRKKLNNEKLSRQDSYYLSRSIRPKLRQAKELSEKNLLNRIKYNKKARIIENKIKKLILDNLSAKAIIIYGSAIYTNYSQYNDIDVLVVTKTRKWKNKWEKLKLIKDIEKEVKKIGLNIDLQIIDYVTLKQTYSENISLIYQLNESRIIYGKINLPKKIKLPKINIKMKLDWSELPNQNPTGEEIYNTIRNTILIHLILKKIIDNYYLSRYLTYTLGKNLERNLKENTATDLQRKMAIEYLKKLNKEVTEKIDEAKWEKLVI